MAGALPEIQSRGISAGGVGGGLGGIGGVGGELGEVGGGSRGGGEGGGGAKIGSRPHPGGAVGTSISVFEVQGTASPAHAIKLYIANVLAPSPPCQSPYGSLIHGIVGSPTPVG